MKHEIEENQRWNYIWDYVLSYKDQMHVLGSKYLGWVKLTDKIGKQHMIRSNMTIDLAKKIVQEALK